MTLNQSCNQSRGSIVAEHKHHSSRQFHHLPGVWPTERHRPWWLTKNDLCLLQTPVIMALVQLVAVAGVLLFCWFLLKTRSRMPNPHPGTRHPPCLTALPVVGSLPFLPSDATDMAHQFMEKSKSLGSVFALYFGSKWVAPIEIQ